MLGLVAGQNLSGQPACAVSTNFTTPFFLTTQQVSALPTPDFLLGNLLPLIVCLPLYRHRSSRLRPLRPSLPMRHWATQDPNRGDTVPPLCLQRSRPGRGSLRRSCSLRGLLFDGELAHDSDFHRSSLHQPNKHRAKYNHHGYDVNCDFCDNEQCCNHKPGNDEPCDDKCANDE